MQTKVTVHGIAVILSAAKDLGRIVLRHEILRCAQDDRCFAGPQTVKDEN
jgi:hypothetical protein